MKPRVLITGASGYLAHRLVPMAAEKSAVFGMVRCVGRVQMPATAVAFDLTDTDGIAAIVDTVRPSAIIHAAAVNPGADEASMDAVNHRASAELAAVAASREVRYVMVSTGSVHSGLEAPYRDDASPDPVNEYGRSKAAGERAVLACNPAAVIVRTSLIYGLDNIDRGTRSFRDRLARGEQLALFEDVYRQPVWIDSLAEALCDLAFNRQSVSGTMNFVGTEKMSRAEFAIAMMNHWQIETQSGVSFCAGAAKAGVQKDLSCLCERADALGYSRPGVNEVLRNRKEQ